MFCRFEIPVIAVLHSCAIALLVLSLGCLAPKQVVSREPSHSDSKVMRIRIKRGRQGDIIITQMSQVDRVRRIMVRLSAEEQRLRNPSVSILYVGPSYRIILEEIGHDGDWVWIDNLDFDDAFTYIGKAEPTTGEIAFLKSLALE